MKHIHTAALACIATTCLSAFGFMTPEKQFAVNEFHATISGYTNMEAAATGERKSFGFRNTAAEVQHQSKGKQVPTPGPAVLLASVTTEPVIQTARPGQAKGQSPGDLEKEEAMPKEWAVWQAKMKADFDRTAALRGSVDLQARAWDRFLGTWGQGNPMSRDDENLREQARQRAEVAKTEATRPTQAPSTTAGQAFKDCADCPAMVVVPAGSFTMGSNTGDADEKPVHNVNIKGFAIGETEVTKGQFAAFVAASGHDAGNRCRVFTGSEWEDAPGYSWRNPGFSQTDSDPVACINWNDAQAYVRWVAQKTGKDYRLPSEAQWEYACRAGSIQSFCGSDNAESVAVYGRMGGDNTQPVGTKQANAWGLYDMSGNLWEWTQDCWNGNYQGAPSDGSAWTTGTCRQRVLRGGSWSSYATSTRAALRGRDSTSSRDYYIGFRLARMVQ